MDNPARAAAQEIAALINSSPRSPRIDELEPIIASVMIRQLACARVTTPAPAVLASHRMLADHDQQPMGKELSEEWGALLGAEVRTAKQAFAKAVQTWEDVALLATLCLRWNFPHHDDDDQEEMRKLLAQCDGVGMDQQALAHLLRAICTMGGFVPGEIPTAPTGAEAVDLCTLQQRLEAVAQQYRDAKHCDEATRQADVVDGEMCALSRRIFASPITIHNLKQRAVLARHWHQFAYDAEKWTVPEDCGSWEDEVIAHLIDGVLQIGAPLDPSPQG